LSALTRRAVLGGLAAFASAMVLDPNRALWVRGAKMISIPAPRFLTTEEIGNLYIETLTEWFGPWNKEPPLMGALYSKEDVFNGELPEWALGIISQPAPLPYEFEVL
jgi:hypothetical protein